jgi:hypothetical protein
MSITIDNLYEENDASVAIKPERGMTFNLNITPTHLAVWIGVHCLKEYKSSVKKTERTNNGKYYGWVCSSPNCSWKLHVSKGKSKNNNQWTVRSEAEYYCMEHINCAFVCNASVKVLQQSYSTSMVSTDTKPMFFLSTATDTGVLFGKKQFTIVHPDYNHATKKGYDKAYRTVHQINQSKIDPFADSFGLLPEFANIIRDINPGSTVTLQGEDTGHAVDNGNERFVRMFVMLGAQATCAANCKPVISYDGGFLKVSTSNKYIIFTC